MWRDAVGGGSLSTAGNEWEDQGQGQGQLPFEHGDHALQKIALNKNFSFITGKELGREQPKAGLKRAQDPGVEV